MAIGALGIVFGDIGTSPLYAFREAVSHKAVAIDVLHVHGVLSLLFWAMLLVVSVKYVLIVLRADNRGEGGNVALLALISGGMDGRRWAPGIVLLGIVATALFYGDAIITPAISVLSAVEGLTVVDADLSHLTLPLAIVVLIGLFAIQGYGTARVGTVFGSVMLVYFLVIAVLGFGGIARHPEILRALDPRWAVQLWQHDPRLTFLMLGTLVLAVTGAEALYAGLGHFGREPITANWFCLVLPCLMVNYLGQGAIVLSQPETAQNPFFMLAPDWGALPLVILATVATVIASQAVISSAYSVTRQAIQLGFLPRMAIRHTSASTTGQIYIPAVNWSLLILVLGLAIAFGSSSRLAAAYGIAVTGTMLITSCMLGILLHLVWRWNIGVVWAVVGLFLAVDGLLFASNLAKIPDGAWVPLLVGAAIFILLSTWATGRRLMRERLRQGSMPVEHFLASTAAKKRVPGTAVFLSATSEGVPPALLHNLKHNKVLHQRNVLLTVLIADAPYVDKAERVELENIGSGFHRIQLHYGFMEEIDVPRDLPDIDGEPLGGMDTSYFLGRQTLIAAQRPGMAIWREKLFAWMVRNSESATAFFKLPTNRVVELGSQLEI